MNYVGERADKHARTHTHTRARTRAHTHIHTRTHARTHTHTHTLPHTHAHTHTHTHTHTEEKELWGSVVQEWSTWQYPFPCYKDLGLDGRTCRIWNLNTAFSPVFFFFFFLSLARTRKIIMSLVLLEVRPGPDKDIFHTSCCFVRGIFGYLLLLSVCVNCRDIL